MDSRFYQNLVTTAGCIPIATELVVHRKEDAQSILTDGAKLGAACAEAAAEFQSPLAIPRMDLTLEKAQLLTELGVPEHEIEGFHFSHTPDAALLQGLAGRLTSGLVPRLRAQADAVSWIASHTSLLPVGMAIGPFSLLTKLLADPITPVYLAGADPNAGDDDPEVDRMLVLHRFALAAVEANVALQIDAGAKAIIICEPAANQIYFSPTQIESGSTVFEDFVIRPLLRIKEQMAGRDVDLYLHDCGEMTDAMLERLASVEPAILSLGSSRVLWHDAQRVPKQTILWGNLPSKRFYSDDLCSVEQVRVLACELRQRMKEVGHPFILSSECDVLPVAGCTQTIEAKVQTMVRHGR